MAKEIYKRMWIESECKNKNTLGFLICKDYAEIALNALLEGGKMTIDKNQKVGWTRSREEVIAKIDEYLKLPIERQLEPINIGFYNALRWMVDEDEAR